MTKVRYIRRELFPGCPAMSTEQRQELPVASCQLPVVSCQCGSGRAFTGNWQLITGNSLPPLMLDAEPLVLPRRRPVVDGYVLDVAGHLLLHVVEEGGGVVVGAFHDELDAAVGEIG